MSNLPQQFSEAALRGLASRVRGHITLPGDKNYDDVRKVYNAMIDKYPALIIRCRDVADVQEAIRFARENDLPVAIRGGGHNGGGLGLCNGGLVIDLSGIKYVRVNQAARTVRTGGGNLWGDVDHATHAFGLAVPSGIISTTGVGGLTLGGGVGYLSRKYGLTIDNLLEADMVLADGSSVTVHERQYEDLFWAIRGGGGNFGVVTSFKFRAHPVDKVFGGPTLWPLQRADEIMEWYDGFIGKAPEDLNGFLAVLTIPGPPFPEALHHKQFCGIVWCYSGELHHANDMFKPVLEKEPIFHHLDAMPFPSMQRLFDGLFPSGLQWYWRADFFNEIPAGARAIHKEYGSKMPTPLSQMHLYPINGASGRVGKEDTAWAYRDAKYAGVIVGVDPDPANAPAIAKWCKDYWDALHPFSAGGAYLNFMMDEGRDRVKASYRQNYERLTKIKLKYDPDNFFRINQNIIPAQQAPAAAGL